MLAGRPLRAKPPPKGDSFMLAMGLYGAVGIQLVIAVVGGALLGNYFDERWNTNPWLLLLGLFVGSGAGFFNLFRVLLWKQKRKDRQKK